MGVSEILDHKYCESLSDYHRRKSRVVKIGDLALGGDHPIRVQSMTTVDTMDTQGSIEQSIRMIDAGCELVRITAPSIKEAENLRRIKAGLRNAGYDTPLVADIHFTPNAAELAARIVEKVRINPGNYADKKKFETIEYTDSAYQEELDRIRIKFEPLVKICKEHGTAMRIGTNHGSLSDRIMSRYGDTPMGMVESALEFLRICDDLNYHDIVLSMKSSNPQVMVQAYRLLVNCMDQEGLEPYPLHLGVTEAGEAEDGRIKSAVGIGTLLEDGLGDTIRVSLTEEPEAEAPVAIKLVNQVLNRQANGGVEIDDYPIDPFNYKRRETVEVLNFGKGNVPRVIADYSAIDISDKKDLKSIGHHYLSELDKWSMTDLGADYIYSGTREIPFMLPNGLKQIVDWEVYKPGQSLYPLISLSQLQGVDVSKESLVFLKIKTQEVDDLVDFKNRLANVVMILTSEKNTLADLRTAYVSLIKANVEVPVVIQGHVNVADDETYMLKSSSNLGGLLVDGLGDGVMFAVTETNQLKFANDTAFGILQAARTRITKTEYISCPSCGRTLFDLQETTAMIRKRTDHLKGLKIGIMGCIVNGPGEMADADFGYVGSGKGKITLYKGMDVMKRGVASENALDELIEIIKSEGKWIEPPSNSN
ncbi:MAG: (E)-4-hydroxy-3-methylbut-2-enyl-diphosphate synthase [Cyclobacteriaceae bacterium]